MNLPEVIEANKNNGWPDLSHQKRAFALEFIANGFKHRDAAIHVGMSAESGVRLLRDPLVSAYIAHVQETQFSSQIITKQYVENLYLTVMPKLMGDEEVPMVSGQGVPYVACKFHGPEVVSVMRDLSKVTGYVKEETSNKNLVNVTMNFGAVMDNPEVVVNGERITS